MPFRISPMELIIVLVIVLIIFGVGKLPQAGKSIGEGLKSFRKASSGDDEEEKATKVEVVSEAANISEKDLAEFRKWRNLKTKANDNS